MCRKSTHRAALLVLLATMPVGLYAQTAAVRNQAFRPDWRRIGNSAVDLSLASLATGPVDRVWYSADGATLFALTRAGRKFATQDFETWTPTAAPGVPAEESYAAEIMPEAEAKVRLQNGNIARLYAVGHNAWRSDDGGRNWTNLTGYRQDSIIGPNLADAAVSPRDPDDIVVCGASGVWRSLDGGMSWTGLNQGLPNLPARRLLGIPGGLQSARLLVDSGQPMELEWAPGEKQAWRVAPGSAMAPEVFLRAALTRVLNTPVTAVTAAGTYLYAGTADGRLLTSPDQGRTWLPSAAGAGSPVESIFVDSKEPRLAIAAAGRVFRTINGGLLWQDETSNLAGNAVHAAIADRTSGALYAATDEGVFLAFTDLNAAGPAPQWAPLAGNLPSGPVRDVKLDPAGSQVFAVVDGYGVFSAVAPHRFRDLRVVSAADFTPRAAAPGALLSVLGPLVRSATSGGVPVPVLDANDSESQIQVPFEAQGSSLSLAIESAGGRVTLGVPLGPVSPAIFIDPDGTPFLLDAETGVRLDTRTPARSGARIQILATGFGRVRPAWPTGLAAPLENVPRVVATVRGFVDRKPVEVTSATLAPGYIGFYLIELQLPEVVNAGPAELYLESDGQQSNRVRVYLEP